MELSGVLIPVMGILVPIVVVPTTLGLKYARLARELEHAERMKALEMGRTLPGDEPWTSPARICAMIGAGVPVLSLALAWLASESIGYHEEVWGMACGVGVTAVISGSILAARHFGQQHRLQAEALRARTSMAHAKPDFDPDAYDVVGSRG